MENTSLDVCIQKILMDDMDGLRQLYEMMDKSVYMLALSILHDKEMAQDVLQDTFIKVKTSAHTYRPGTNPKAWILTIARNLAITQLRKRKNETLCEDIFYQEDNMQTPFVVPSKDVENSLLVESALSVLNDSEREIVSLYIVGGLKHREISSMLNIPLGSVLWKYNNALKKMNKHLHKIDQFVDKEA